MVDTAVIGNLGQAAPLGAVGLGAIILGTIYWACGFLRMSTLGLAAQAQGARLPAVAGGCTSDRIDCLGIRQNLYRRNADARDAADDAVVAGVYVMAVLILPPVFGNHGLWAALMVLNLARALTLVRAYPGVAAKAVKTDRLQSDPD